MYDLKTHHLATGSTTLYLV